MHQGGGLGGAPVSLLKLLGRLDPSGFAPRAIVTEPGPLLDYARAVAVPAAVVPSGGAFFYSAHAQLAPRTLAHFVATFPSAVRLAQAALRRYQPDLLHLNTSVLLAWGAAARRQGIPVVWTVREVLGPNPLLRRWHADFIAGHARRVVAISRAVQACLPPSSAVRLVYNGVDPAEYAPARLDERAAVRAGLGLDAQDDVVMALGSVQRAKGHWLLLDAVELLAAQRPRTRLVLVCGGLPESYAASPRGRLKRALGLPLDSLDGLLREARRRGIRDRVVVTGFVPDVARILAAADVVAFPSIRAEGFGRPLVEAMATALPLVATDVGPSAEIVGPAAGIVVPPTAADLAAALQRLLDSPERRCCMGQAGRERVAALFTLDRQVRAMEAVYHEALSG